MTHNELKQEMPEKEKWIHVFEAFGRSLFTHARPCRALMDPG